MTKTKRVHMPHPNKEQIKNMQISFLQSFGASYRVMSKDDLAFMVSNQSQNYKKLHADAGKIVMMGMAWKRQRDYYLKLIRSKRVDISTIHEIEEDMNKVILEDETN